MELIDKLMNSKVVKLLRECLDRPRTTDEIYECGKRIGYSSNKEVWMDLQVLKAAGLIRYDYDLIKWVATNRLDKPVSRWIRIERFEKGRNVIYIEVLSDPITVNEVVRRIVNVVNRCGALSDIKIETSESESKARVRAFIWTF